MSEIIQPTMEKLIRQVLTSDKFEETIQNGEKGYFDKQEKVFISQNIIPSLIKEITLGPSAILGSDKLEEYFALCQVRIKRALKKKFEHNVTNSYKSTLMRYMSTEFLKLFTGTEVTFAALYIDLVGSTLMSMKLPTEKLTTIIDIFTQEMSSVVSINQGYVLKYAGDAVIAFFPKTGTDLEMCTNALHCAANMQNLLQEGINSILEPNGFEPLSIRVGIESGANKIMTVGGNVDIIGYTMNIAAKVTSMSKPNGISIGQRCYSYLQQEQQQKFTLMELDPAFWKYKDENNEMYKVYTSNK